MGIKVTWPLLVSAWVSPLGGGVTGALRFATYESLDEVLGGEGRLLTAVQLETSPGAALTDGAAVWSKEFYQLLVDREVKRSLVDTAFLCVDGDPQLIRSIGVLTTPQEAQQILSSIVYQPDANYDSGMWDDPMCITQRGGNEIIRMQLLPVIVDAPSPSKGMCVAADMADDLTFEAEGGSTHEKKISVVSVNDPPKTERERRSNVPVLSGRSCVGLTTSEQEDAAVSSTTLQQKFDDPPDMLVREAIMAFEDTDMLLGGEVNLDAFVDLKAGSTISVSVHNGVVYSVGDGVHIDPSSKQQISTNDVEHLRSVLSNLRYIPNPNFNGIDEIDFNARGETATLYIYVQAENDPPKLEFESDEMKDWYKYPRMFLPSFQVEDPDSDQIFQVDIHVENGTLFVEQMSTRAFDGISVEFNASLSSLRLTSGLSRLNTLFLQRLVEVVPKSCLKGTTPISCTAIIELCVNDGSISYCEMINLPEQDAFYRVTVSSWAKSLNVTAESSLNISEAFKIHQRFDVMYELLLRVHVSSGFCRIGVPNCGALRDFYSPSELQPSNLLGGMTKIIYAGDADCLNKVLASIQLQSSHVSNTTVVIKAELLTAQMRLLASESISVVIIDKPTLIRISAVRINGDEPWLVGIDNYTNLTSLVNISIVAGPEAIVDGTILELEVFCQNCLWKYRSFVPQVSYEHAQIPNSKLKFLGLYESLRKVIAILQLSVNYNSADAEVIHLQMSLASPLSERVWGYDWNSSTEISIPFTLYASNLLWEAQRNLQFVQAPNDTVDLSGVKLIGKDETPSLNLTILLDCTLGQAKVSLPRANPTFLELPCDPNQPPISLTMQRSQVNDVMQSTLVKVVPSERSLLVQLHLAAVETAQIGVVDEAFIDLEFRVSRQLSETKFALRNESRATQVDEEKLQSIGEILTVTGNPNEPTWFRMLAHVTHGRLSVPIAVCCVEIRETEHENEVDIIGTALALERAIAVVQFQGHEQYSGKDLLEMTFASFPTNPDHPNTSLVVAIDIVAVNHASNKIMLTSVNDIDSLAAYDAAVIPSWSQPSDLEALDTVTNDEHVASFLSSVAPDTSSIRTERDSFIALKTTLLPLIHIEGSIEGPLSSQYWEIITLALSVGMEWSISGVSIRDSSGEAFVSDDDLTLEIDADIGTIHFAACDGLEISEGSDDMFTRTITVIGKLDLLNAALLTLRYLCSSCCNRQDTVTFQVSNPLAPPPEISHKRVIKIDQLHDVPVPHVITNASLYYSTEDEAFQFPNLTLRFADNNDSPHEETPTLYQLDIQVSYGDIFLVNADDSPRDGRMLKLEGTVINLERNLTRMIYLPPQNWNEEQFPGGHIVKWKFTVSYENESVETFADIVITPRVDIPVITVPQSVLDPSHYMSDYLSVLRLECLPLVCDEDTPMQLDGFFVRAADATKRALLITDLLVLSMSVTHGVLTLGDPLRSNCISQLMGPQSWRRVSFSANAECINRILSGMTYIGEPNFSGADQLKIRVEYARKLNAAVDEVTVPIIVVELNDAPYIEARSVFYEAVEDIPLVIEGLYLRDPDANEENLRVVMETSCGQLTLLRSIGINQTVQTMENGAMRLTLEGTLWSLNAAIASVVYTSAKDWNSLQFHSAGGLNGFDTITINSSDLSSFNASSISVLFLYVDADVDPVVIDTPSNVLTSIYADDPPGTLRGDEDTWIGINGLVFSSVDDTSQMTLVLSLSVVHGILSLSQLRGITFLEGTDDLAYTVKIKGTFLNVNECVAGLRYIAHENYYGKDTLIVVAYAVDQYTEQQTPSSLISVAITVDPVNDAPLWNTGSSITREIQQGRSARIAGVYFGDVDVAVLDCTVESCMMDLIVEASQGFVTLSNQSSTSFSNDMTIKKIAYVVVSGTPDELNTMLSKMTFEFDAPEYYRADNPGRIDIKLQLTVDDRGTFGRGGPQISTTTVVFSPVTWTQHELSILAPEDVLEMEEDTTFYFNGDLQLIDLDSARSFYNLLELTIDCTGGAFALSDHTTGIQVLRNESGGDVVVRGYFAQLNAALNGSSYIPATNWYGSEKLSLSVVELNHLEKSSSVAIGTVFLFVAPVCDEPEWKSQQRADESLSMKEDGYMLIDSISLASPDLGDEQHEVKVLISVNHGGIMLSMMKGLFVEQAVYSTSEGRLVAQHIPPGNTYPRARLFFEELVFRGRVSDINSALKGMIFKPWLDYNSDGWPIEEISFIATSSCGDIEGSNKSSSSAIAIAVDAVNDPPVLISKHFQLVSLPYSLRALNAISSDSFIEAVENLPQRLEPMELYDPDYELREGDLRLLVNISCIHCIITSMTLSEHQPSDDLIILTSSWGSRDGTQLVVHGGLSSLNSNLLSQLTFQGADNFNGIAFVLIEISDLGNYGEGGEQHTLFALGVDIAAVNDIPQIHFPQFQSQEPVLQLDEDASVLIVGAPALSSVSESGRRQTLEWSLMSTNLIGNESTTRLYSLSNFLGSSGIAVSFLVSYNSGLLFSGQDPDLGEEIWYSDGTAAGTNLLKDIFPGCGGSSPSYLTPFSLDNRVYFAAEGPHLSWLVKDVYRDECQSFRQSSLDPDIYYTVAALNVWDPEETYDCPLGYRWMSTSQAQQVFLGTIDLEGHNEEPLTYFDQCGWRGYAWGGQIRKYFRFSDSKFTGAYKHAGFRDSYRLDTGFQTDSFAGIVCYRESPSYRVSWGTQLWATDGTADGTQRVARISTDPEGSKPSYFVELNQRLYFQATSPEFGAELWSTDGTGAGTYLVADVESGLRSSTPQYLTVFDSRVYFSAETQDYGRELWFSDGDPRFEFNSNQHATVGTGLLLDICVGASSSFPQHFAVLTSSLLFQADDCVHGPELWSTDGSHSGTTLVLDIYKGSAGSFPRYLTSFAGKVYFQADDGIHESELWVTDGTSSGTVMLLDIAPGVQGGAPSFLTVLYTTNAPSGMLVFAAQAEQDRFTEFWQSDGTSVGTTKLFPQSREIVELNVDSLNLQLAENTLVAISSQPDRFFYLGRENGLGIDFQRDAADRLSALYAEDVANTRSITLQVGELMVDEQNLTLSLNCSKGWLSLGQQCGDMTVSMNGTPDQKKAAVLELEGPLGALNCAVEKLTYHSKPQENGWDDIYVTLSQGVSSGQREGASAASFADNTERDSSYTVSKRMLVEIRAINDPPSINMASTFYAPLRQWVALAGIEIADPDSAEGMLYVNIAVYNGRLRATLPYQISADGPTALHPTANGDIAQVLEFATTLEQAKNVFSRLEYSCDDRYACSNSQRDYLTVQVDDNGFSGAGGPQVATKTAQIIITP